MSSIRRPCASSLVILTLYSLAYGKIVLSKSTTWYTGSTSAAPTVCSAVARM